jgi:hypothetical protein
MIRTTRVGHAAPDCAKPDRETAGAAKAAAPKRKKSRRGKFMGYPFNIFLFNRRVR